MSAAYLPKCVLCSLIQLFVLSISNILAVQHLDSKTSCWRGSSTSILANTKSRPTVSRLVRVAFRREQTPRTSSKGENAEFRKYKHTIFFYFLVLSCLLLLLGRHVQRRSKTGRRSKTMNKVNTNKKLALQIRAVLEGQSTSLFLMSYQFRMSLPFLVFGSLSLFL